ncbi:Arm DNA-binding domain-containing protein [Nocardiopsis sp. NPDC058789]|uniref:Arm DNA-binding domain-containing protein n=1 Tax=Nocardiopsis sp. NPDC058789 TaxID=3346634 RepID=UPI00367142B6
MAYAEKMEAKRGTTYRACWYVPGRKSAIKKGGFATKKEAKRYAEEQETDARRLRPRADSHQLTFREWAQEWHAGLDLEPSTMRNYTSILQNHLIPHWGEWKMKDLESADQAVAVWKKKLLEDYADGTASGISSKLFTILSDAVDQGIIYRNPAIAKRRRGKVAPKRKRQREARYEHIVNPTEVFLIAERCAYLSGRDDEFVMILATYWLGLRWGEQVGLTDECVSTTFRLDHQLYEHPGKRWYWKEPKSGSERDLDVPPFLAGLLDHQLRSVTHPHAHEEWCPCGDGLEDKYRHSPGSTLFCGIGEGEYHQKAGPFRDQYFYPAARGEFYGGTSQAAPVALSDPEDVWSVLPTGKGITRPSAPAGQWEAICPDLTVHGLRHSHRALLEEVGTPKVLMDDRMGHADPSISARYSHVTPAMRRDLVERLQERWEESVAARSAMNLESPVPLVRAVLEAHSRSTPDLESRRSDSKRGMVA